MHLQNRSPDFEFY